MVTEYLEVADHESEVGSVTFPECFYWGGGGEGRGSKSQSFPNPPAIKKKPYACPNYPNIAHYTE